VLRSRIETRSFSFVERSIQIEQLGGLCLDRIVVPLDADERPDAGEQLLAVERLRDEVVRTGRDRWSSRSPRSPSA
jgi:hypothetical protein